MIRIFSLNENRGLFFFYFNYDFMGIVWYNYLKDFRFFFKNDDLYRDIKYTKLSIRQKRKFFLIFIFQLIMLLSSCGLVVLNFYKIIGQEEEKEYSKYGKIQLVRIYKFGYQGKGSQRAFFNYYCKDTKFKGSISKKDNYQIGDSIEIMYSTRKPFIYKTLKW
ncbi:MAG: hypothetical protein IPN09_06960 [Bacteroidetes bacterium]|nr:hypothetical protein [Bacteroidota bacterium]